MGAADVFAMGPEYAPGAGMRRFISGTPPILGMLALQDSLRVIAEAGVGAIRAKSVALTEFALHLTDSLLAPFGVTVASPRDAEERGGHVTLSHPAMRAVTARLWASDVIPDYREPDALRIGLAPLSTSFAELERGVRAIADALQAEAAPGR
jgi:kynureninase